MKVKPIDVRALEGYRIWIKYEDGVEGEVDLSDLEGRGVFSAWSDYREFEKVHIGSHGSIAWSKEIDLCPDSIYLRLTQKRPEDLFPNLRPQEANA